METNSKLQLSFQLPSTSLKSSYPKSADWTESNIALGAAQGFAILAQSSDYCLPKLMGPGSCPRLRIRNGRHPVLDSLLGAGVVPNNVDLSGREVRAAVVTGPNMGGKSCYIRQVALIVLMAQVSDCKYRAGIL